MRIETLTIGDELLDGRVTDTNTVRLAQALSEVGIHLSQRTSITDDIDIIIREAQASASRGTSLCVVSGGLGPTSDDLTAEAFARMLGVPLVRDATYAARITERLARRGYELNENHLKQADRPQGAELLDNTQGSAPGFAVSHGGCRFVIAPGIPREFDAMVDAAVVAPLRAGAKPVARRALYCFGVVEAETDKRLQGLQTQWPKVRLQFRVKFPEVHITLHAGPDAVDQLDAAYAFAQEKLGKHAYATHAEGDGFARRVLEVLRQRKATLACAESCTGGLVADLLTDVPGSSDVLMGGVVAYSNAVKESQLGVASATLQAHGAVSEAVVVEMARGVRQRLGTTYGVAISGIAGPDGGTPEKPVGTVWLAAAGPQGERTHKLSLPFDRRNNKLVSAFSALDMVRGMAQRA